MSQFNEDVLLRIKSGEVLTEVNLSNRGLSEFPEELFRLIDCLEVLNLGGNCLSSLPSNFSSFTKLRVLFFAGNRFQSIPICLGSLPSLFMLSFKGNELNYISPESLSPSIGWLILTDNNITHLPETIGNLRGLRKLMLANNKLETLPESLCNCVNLELVRLSCNKLSQFPSFMLKLPKLAWLSIAGNCFSGLVTESPPAHASSAPIVPLSSVLVGDIIGEGASGHVYEATWGDSEAYTQAISGQDTLGADGSPFAFKVFKGQSTSDGHPEDEMKMCLAAGFHRNMISAAACVVADGSDKVAGLLFRLIPKTCPLLAGPPSFQSVTRDTYAADTQYSLQFVYRLVRGIASAVAHLHSRRITHGDLYGHNIHVHEDGTPVLLDFGAAFQCDPEELSLEVIEALQRLEVRAFGCLLEELLEKVPPIEGKKGPGDDESAGGSAAAAASLLVDDAEHPMEVLTALRDACLGSQISSRPSFESICQSLYALDDLIK